MWGTRTSPHGPGGGGGGVAKVPQVNETRLIKSKTYNLKKKLRLAGEALLPPLSQIACNVYTLPFTRSNSSEVPLCKFCSSGYVESSSECESSLS